MLMSSPPTRQPGQHRPPPMPAATESNQPLHNYVLPVLLKWGSTRTARHEKSDADDGRMTLRSFDSLFGDCPRSRRPPPSPPRSSYRLAPTVLSAGKKRSSTDRDKLIVELQLHYPAKKMKAIVPDVVRVVDTNAGAEEAISLPWNLRTRSSACQPTDDESRRKSVPPPVENTVKPSRVKRVPAEKKERRKFAVSLSKEEIADDIFAMTGSRPPRRPKKRPRNVQNDVDALQPGMWLSEVTADMYKVA